MKSELRDEEELTIHVTRNKKKFPRMKNYVNNLSKTGAVKRAN